MFTEAQLGGVLFAPIVLYCIVAVVVFVPLRFVLGRLRVFAAVWHPALFELALYLIITGAIVYLAA
jgi:protein AaeX